MTLTKIIKYGLPFSFLYCTTYIQDVWREGDERLFEEQKRSWKNCFNLAETGYRTIAGAFNFNMSDSLPKDQLVFVSKLESLDMKSCWNQKVMCTFKTIDTTLANPQAAACKLYRKIQPYVNKSTSDPQS